jgi:hypothetical protein
VAAAAGAGEAAAASALLVTRRLIAVVADVVGGDGHEIILYLGTLVNNYMCGIEQAAYRRKRERGETWKK